MTDQQPARDGHLGLWKQADAAATALQKYLWANHRISPECSIVKAIRRPDGLLGLQVQIDPSAERHAEILPKICEGFHISYLHWDGVIGSVSGGNVPHLSSKGRGSY